MVACTVDPGMVWEICRTTGGPVIIAVLFALAVIGPIAGAGRDPSETGGH